MFAGKIKLLNQLLWWVSKEKRDRGVFRKVAIFGISKGKKVYKVVINDTKSQILMPLMSKKIKLNSIVFTDNYKFYDAFNISTFIHKRINHGEEFIDIKNHIKAQENF